MPTVYSDAHWTGNYTYTRVRVDYSGTSATAILLYTRTNTYSGSTGSGRPAGFNFGGGWADMSSKTFYGQQTDAEICRCSFSISMSGGTYSGYTDGQDGYLGFSGSVSIPSQYTPPTGLAASNIRRGIESFTANVSITGWGVGSGNRYRELQCWTYNASSLVEPRRYQPVYGNDLSGDITVDNASKGALNITGNTRYTLGVYASNGSAYAGSKRIGDYTTRAYAPTLSVGTVGETSVIVNYSTPADGGQYTKNIQYSLDGGSNWTTGATVSTGSASSGSFTISGLTDDTTYTLKCRVSTSAGETNGSDVIFTTLKSHKFYGPVNGVTKKAKKLYGSVNGQSKEIKKLYASVNGQTKRIF